MTSFKVVPLDEEINQHVRTTLTDPIYGHPVQVTIAQEGDYGPCRSCLRTTASGERRILFVYNPFAPKEQTSDFAGPIYIHDQPCQNYTTSFAFPEPIRDLPIVFKGYDAGNHFVADELSDGQSAEQAIEELLKRPEVTFIHVRNTEARCFIMRIERADEHPN
jgi:hypothetical protein